MAGWITCSSASRSGRALIWAYVDAPAPRCGGEAMIVAIFNVYLVILLRW